MVQDFALIDGEPPQANRRGEVVEGHGSLPGEPWYVGCRARLRPGVVHAIRARRYQAFREGQWKSSKAWRPGETGWTCTCGSLGDEGQE